MNLIRYSFTATFLCAFIVSASVKSSELAGMNHGDAAWRVLAQADKAKKSEQDQRELEEARQKYEEANKARMKAEKDFICNAKVFPIHAQLAAALDGNAPSRAAFIKNPDAASKAEFCKDNDRVLQVLQKLEAQFMDNVQKDDGQCKTHPSWVKFATDWIETNKIANGYREKICVAAR
jgi:hypothetical protein